MAVEFFIDIEDVAGNKLGSGPLASVSKWRYVARFDRAGTIDFDFAANDPQAGIVENRRIARAFARIAGIWVEVGAGVIDTLEVAPNASGQVNLIASGLDLTRELSYRTVGTLEIGAGSGATHSAALTAISAYTPPGWVLTPAVSPANDYIYARYGGESVLGALVHLAERTQTHFYRPSGRNLVFTSSFTNSGIRAIQAQGDLAPETCAIVSLKQSVDTHDLLTRISPYGSGQGNARLTLASSNRSAPVGFIFSAAGNYIEHTASTTEYGLVNFPEVEYKEIGPISNTDADLQAAANMLFDTALEELRRRSTLAEQRTYSLTIAGCSALLRPMQTIRVVYWDYDQQIDIDEDLYILEATWEIDASGVRTTGLLVSTDDLWPANDVEASADRAVEGRVFQAHPQLNANAYVTAYTQRVDENEIARFRFRFGSEVVNLQQVLFEFQILPFESTVRSIASDSPTTSSGGSASPSSSSGGGATPSSSNGGGATIAAASGGGVSVAADSGGSSTPSTASGGSATPTSSNNDAGVYQTSDDAHAVATTAPSGTGAGALGTHTHPIAALHHHGTYLAQHTHTLSLAAHTHTVTVAAHTHTVTIASHTHSVTIADHSHTITISAHTHTVTIAAHTHTVSPAISMEYGIFRESPANTYVLTDLDYRVNGGAWLNAEDNVVSAGDGWQQLDITALVMNTLTFRPLQANNLLEIRSLTLNKTATIDAQMSVRTTIQAIAYI